MRRSISIWETKQSRQGTEVYPFWYMEDIKNMMDYFKMKEMLHWYLAFNFGLLLGRRVGDTLSFKWSDFFYENGRMKDEIEIKEQKTGKITRPYVCRAYKDALQLYIDKTGIDPMENYNDFIITTHQKSQLLKDKNKYTDKEWNELFWKATQSQASAYRKQFKIAADACNIQYPVSTHSTRKTFGYWSIKLHPYDVTTVDKLQLVFEHSDRNTTLKYSGIARENMIKLYNDMGDFVTDITNGKKPIIKNSPVLAIKSEDVRELFSKCWDMAQAGEEKFEGHTIS
ncbi:MAG: tyrosine-type recombinase/integrase [Clostridium sp.]|nr:tyrosine-type recombinase/integrase [Clostridium sp.]